MPNPFRKIANFFITRKRARRNEKFAEAVERVKTNASPEHKEIVMELRRVQSERKLTGRAALEEAMRRVAKNKK